MRRGYVMDLHMMKLGDILRHKVTAMVVLPLSLIAVAVSVWQYSSGGGGYQGVGRAFYSDDDGVTWFVDSADKIMPFDHNGKPAVGAAVCAGPDGKQSVAYLMRYTPAALREFEAARAKGQSRSSVSVSPMMEAKKPGAPSTAWVGDTNPSFQAIATPAPGTTPVRPPS